MFPLAGESSRPQYWDYQWDFIWARAGLFNKLKSGLWCQCGFSILSLISSTSQYFHIIFMFLMVYFMPLLISGKVGGNRRSPLVYACSFLLSPQPTSAQAFSKAAAFNGPYSAWRAWPSLWSVLRSYQSKQSRTFPICKWCFVVILSRHHHALPKYLPYLH